MPYITRQDNGLEISIYYETIGEGEPIILHHGNGNCVKDWYTLGYVEKLSPYFQLIMLDSRGYGKSSKPHDPDAYSLKSRADDTIAVLDALHIQQAHCLGGSIGASLCFILARFYPERFKSYIFATPYFELFDENIRAALEKNIETFLTYLENLIGNRIKNEKIRESILANDAKALWAANSSEWFDYKDHIHYIKSPSLFYVGEREPSVESVTKLFKQITNSQLTIFPKLDHAEVYWGGNIVAPIIKNFIGNLG